MRVLLIEDEKPSAHITSKMLKDSGFIVVLAELGEDGYDLGKNYDFDIILLDLKLPDMSGFEVLRKLRDSEVKTPVLILSGNIKVDNKITGLEQGADDYVTKPFNRNELVARIHAVIRRSNGFADKIIAIEDLKIDLSSKTVFRNGHVIPLTGREFQLIELFAMRKGTTVTKDMILGHLYHEYNEADIKTIDVLMFNLRKKLGTPKDGQKYIKTVWGRGYIVEDPEERPIPNVA